MDLTPGTLKGDHYGSIMIRIKVKYELNLENTRERTWIVKTLPEAEGVKKDILSQSNVFNTEMNIYMELLPLVEEILEKHGDNTKFAPR